MNTADPIGRGRAVGRSSADSSRPKKPNPRTSLAKSQPFAYEDTQAKALARHNAGSALGLLHE